MKVLIAGGTGFLGSRLTRSLRADSHDVSILTRHPRRAGDVAYDGIASAIDGADVVVNLAGDPLEAGRWTEARKASIIGSRVTATRTIVDAIRRATRPPRVLLSGSAVGLYGAHGSETLTEESPAGSDFLASACVAWEAEAMTAAPATRIVLLRTGLVLDRENGALPPLAWPFRFFVGGRLGSGEQYWSWIHHEDWTRMVRWAINTADIAGPVNITAPHPVTNREFTQRLAGALHRPVIAPVPAVALRLILGEMADAVILSGQRALPAKAERGGFEFRFPVLDTALSNIYGEP